MNDFDSWKTLGKDIEEFILWLNNGQELEKRFQFFAENLKHFILEKIDPEENVDELNRGFQDTISNCNELRFNSLTEVIPYIIWHFLERYCRFLLIFKLLIQKRILPVKDLQIDVLDVGTGPAQALFAIDEIYSLLGEFSQIRRNNLLQNIRLKLDYVEMSQVFRQFLHSFVEFLQLKANVQYRVPYHFGRYDDFKNWDPKTESYNYDVIIFSNFFTQPESVEIYQVEIKQALNSLRNKGIIIICGGIGSQYPDIYEKIRIAVEVPRKRFWRNRVVVFREVKLGLPRNIMKHNMNDEFGRIIHKFWKEIKEKFQGSLSLNIENIFDDWINSNKDRKWILRVFVKKTSTRRHKSLT